MRSVLRCSRVIPCSIALPQIQTQTQTDTQTDTQTHVSATDLPSERFRHTLNCTLDYLANITRSLTAKQTCWLRTCSQQPCCLTTNHTRNPPIHTFGHTHAHTRVHSRWHTRPLARTHRGSNPRRALIGGCQDVAAIPLRANNRDP